METITQKPDISLAAWNIGERKYANLYMENPPGLGLSYSVAFTGTHTLSADLPFFIALRDALNAAIPAEVEA